MDNLLSFLTSKEVIIVYIVAALACALCFIIYIVEKNNEKIKQRHNTKELNKLVEELKEEVVEEEPEVIYDQPVIQYVEDVVEESVVNQMIDTSVVEVSQPAVSNVAPVTVETTSIVPEEMKESLVVIEEKEDTIEKLDNTIEELQYTTIEPDQQTAKLELQKLTEDLRKQEELAKTQEIEKIALTNYEEQQEATAIISLDELVKKGKEMYESNEITQYEDEGNEPISLEELEKRAGLANDEEYTKPFIIENVVEKEEIVEEEPIQINILKTV